MDSILGTSSSEYILHALHWCFKISLYKDNAMYKQTNTNSAVGTRIMNEY